MARADAGAADGRPLAEPDRRRRPAPEAPDVELELIVSAGDLAAACRRWRRRPAIGVDTEFVRERTFYPGLGLIQVSDGAVNSLIDALAIADLGPLDQVLADPAVIKVFHSCGEDLEVLYHRFGAFPRPVFDTQIAAALAGLGSSPGYGALVAGLFGVDLPKDKTRTNWLKRPLSGAQKRYAALDVAYLLPAYRRLRDRLRRLGREPWLAEELEPLFDAERFWPDPGLAYRRVRAWRTLAPRQLAALELLAAWRENEARRRDLPRNFVLREKALLAVARRRPRTFEALEKSGVLGRRELGRHGRALIPLLRQARELPADELPPATPPPLDLTPYRDLVRRLRQRLAEVAADTSLPAELLATRKTVESLVRRAVAGKTPVLPRKLMGWRRAVAGDALLETVAESGLAVSPPGRPAGGS